MKLCTTREVLLAPLLAVAGVVERRHKIPILANVLIEAGSKEFYLSTTDLEVELQAVIPLVAEEMGKTTVSARKLCAIVRALPVGAEIMLHGKPEHLEINSGSGLFRLAMLSADDFPSVSEITECLEVKIKAPILSRVIAKTQFAMAQQDVRFFLNGLLMHLDGENLVAVATDGHRLALSGTPLKTAEQRNSQVIVPRKAVQELMRMLDHRDEEVVIRIGENHIQVGIGSQRLTAKLIDGSFPDYRRAIPGSGDHVARINREQLAQALYRLSILSDEKYRSIRAELSKECMKLSARNPEQETAEEEVQADYQGNELVIGFNVTYLLDVLSAISTEDVLFKFTDPDAACLIVPDEKDIREKYVVMPMRL
ncbi:MAG: DNA polymerase III subunit beta [Nitrososphaera sp.]|nr:DNA polymerase III subunit beta [Nitrososphaera sp.]